MVKVLIFKSTWLHARLNPSSRLSPQANSAFALLLLAAPPPNPGSIPISAHQQLDSLAAAYRSPLVNSLG
jgi:hypothetical protein